MNRLLTNFLSIFIPDKKKRHEFRQKHKKSVKIKLNVKDRGIIRYFNKLNQINLSTFNLHQKTFPRFKNINQGKDVVLLASGPTLKQYKPLKNVINVGVNRSFQGTSEKCDYIFIQDYSGQTKSYIKELNNYNRDTCIKFYGIASELNPNMQFIPESEVIEANALRYRTNSIDFDNYYYDDVNFAYDIASQPLGDGRSIVFSAMQFILWTHPKKIYLVGCDCSLGGYFNNEKLNEKEKQNYLNTVEIIENWKKLKFFANRYYPDTEIISINPVGLKGIFKDIYQK